VTWRFDHFNFSLTSLGENCDFCKVSEKSEIEWHNGDMRRESVSRKARQAAHEPVSALVATSWGWGRLPLQTNRSRVFS